MRDIDRSSRATGSLARTILERCATRIYVDVRRDVFTFRTKAKVLPIATCVYVSPEGRAPEVLAVGDSVDVPNAEKIALFSDRDQRPPGVELPDLFCHFLRFAIKSMVSWTALVRPVVVFRNVDELEPCFHGYQKAILSDAALFAGALKAHFE